MKPQALIFFPAILLGLSSCDVKVAAKKEPLSAPTPTAAPSPVSTATPLPVTPAAAASDEPVADSITITVASGGRQTFGGFGTSMGNWNEDYQNSTPEQRLQLSQMLWRDLKFNSIRLLINMDEYAHQPGAHNLAKFKKQYVDSGLVADAMKQGVTIRLLQPDSIPEYMREKTKDGTQLKDSEFDNYAILVADSVERIQKELGMELEATGFQNEPNGLERITPDQMPQIVKTLRSELDRRGLAKVKVIGPEQSSVDGVYYEQIDKLKADPAAWEALGAVASHSYNMAANDEAAKRVEGGPDGANLKEYWMTEASENGAEKPGDIFRAVSLASRFLNDVNHRVTHWMHFLGFERSDPKDNATRIIAFTASPFNMEVFQKYYVYQQLSNAFDVGAVFRKSESSKEGGMTWTFGKKPRLVAASARNPDGSWAVGLSNFTADSFSGVQGWADDDWNRTQGGHTPGERYAVTVEIEEAKGLGDIPFVVHRTSASLQNAAGETVVMKDGAVTINVAPMEVVTLRSPAQGVQAASN